MNTIDFILAELSRRTSKLDSQQMKQAIAMYERGDTYTTMSIALSIPRSTIGWFCKQYQIAMEKLEARKPEADTTPPAPPAAPGDPNASVASTIKTETPCICPPAAAPAENKFSWVGPVLVIALVLFLLYIFVQRYGKG